MSELTIPDALTADLRDLFLADQPLDPPLHEDAVRLTFEADDLPLPRLTLLTGIPARVSGMDATARVPFSLAYATGLDHETPDEHRASAGLIDAWLREIRLTRRRALLSSRVWMHDIYIQHPTFSFEDDREQVATVRGEAIVTLARVTLLPD